MLAAPAHILSIMPGLPPGRGKNRAMSNLTHFPPAGSRIESAIGNPPPVILGFSANTRRPSRTRALVEAAGIEVTRSRRVTFRLVDLIDAGPGLGGAFERADLSPEAAALVRAVETADALIVGTPVHKGSYTGLFKHLFDLVDPGMLARKPVLLTATGGGPRHALVVEHALRPLFGFFEALTVPTAVYASEQDFADGRLVDAGVVGRLGDAARQFASLVGHPANVAAHEPTAAVGRVVGALRSA